MGQFASVYRFWRASIPQGGEKTLLDGSGRYLRVIAGWNTPLSFGSNTSYAGRILLLIILRFDRPGWAFASSFWRRMAQGRREKGIERDGKGWKGGCLIPRSILLESIRGQKTEWPRIMTGVNNELESRTVKQNKGVKVRNKGEDGGVVIPDRLGSGRRVLAGKHHCMSKLRRHPVTKGEGEGQAEGRVMGFLAKKKKKGARFSTGLNCFAGPSPYGGNEARVEGIPEMHSSLLLHPGDCPLMEHVRSPAKRVRRAKFPFSDLSVVSQSLSRPYLGIICSCKPPLGPLLRIGSSWPLRST